MTSDRNVEAAVLDAVRDSVLAVGVRRTTLTDVARRAGLSRMTLYRYFEDVTSMLQELMTREFSALLVGALEDVAGLSTARARLVEASVRIVERLGRHPLFRRILDVDPELLLPYVIDRLGATQRSAVGQYAQLLRAGFVDGSVRHADPQVVSYCLQLTVQSFVFSARITERELTGSQVCSELRVLLDAYLRPQPEWSS